MKFEQLKIKNMEKYENHFKKMDDVINKLENLSDVVSNAQEAVSKVEGNVEVMNKAAEALTLRGCPHYASRRRASRRGPSGVVCLDTWAMRRDYSRLQA